MAEVVAPVEAAAEADEDPMDALDALDEVEHAVDTLKKKAKYQPKRKCECVFKV